MLAGETFASWFFALMIEQSRDKWQRKMFMLGECLVLLGLLGYYKYFNFLAELVNDLAGLETGLAFNCLFCGAVFLLAAAAGRLQMGTGDF